VVNKPLDVEFNAIKVGCILLFRTISIRTKVQTKPISAKNIPKRFNNIQMFVYRM